MPRTPKGEDEAVEELTLSEEAREAAIQEVLEDEQAQEAARSFLADGFPGESEEAGDSEATEVDEGSAEPVQPGEPGPADDGGDAVPEEAEGDAGGAGEEPARTEEPAEAEVAVTEANEVDIRTAAERRPTTMGGTTVWTDF